MVIGPWSEGGPWNTRGIEGIARFLARVWSVVTEPAKRGAAGGDGVTERELEYWTHHTVRRVTDDFEGFRFNTAIAALMEFSNVIQQAKNGPLAGGSTWAEALRVLVALLAPLCPHVAEELWVEHLGQPYSVHTQPWPVYDPQKATAERVTLVLQVNGRVRDRVEVEAGISDARAREVAITNPKVRQYLDGRTVADVIVVSGRLVNVVVR
jgi:leucyl-tRNA synthetase